MDRAVFLDRDGVVVENIGGVAPTSVKDLQLISEVIPIIRKIREQGYKIFIVSNQPDIALGIIDESTKKALTERFEQLLHGNQVPVDGIYYCFHHPNGVVKEYTKECSCRKPKPGMLLKAMQDHKIDPAKSFIIGDRASDIKAGNLAGVKTILLDSERAEETYLLEYNVKPDFIIERLNQVLEIIK